MKTLRKQRAFSVLNRPSKETLYADCLIVFFRQRTFSGCVRKKTIQAGAWREKFVAERKRPLKSKNNFYVHPPIMPQHKSASKRIKQDAKRRERNRYHRSRMRSMIKNLREATDEETASQQLPEIKSYLDRLASKGIIHKNKAANYKSELENHVNKMK